MARDAKGKLRVGVVFGGRSGEHEVSLASAASVIAAIDRSGFEVVPIGITREGRWLVGGDPMRALTESAAQRALTEGGAEADVKRGLAARASGAAGTAGIMRSQSSEGLPPGLRQELDVVMIMLHGPRGEDGTIQGLLELAEIPYVGARVLGSAIGMDKVAMKDMFRAHGLPMVEYLAVSRHDWERRPQAVEAEIARRIGFPCFVKPANLGSSVGISKVKAPEDLGAALAEAARHDRRLVVERAVVAREVEVAVLGNDEPEASLPGEVRFAGEWYDYETKYAEGQTTFQIPAPLSAGHHRARPRPRRPGLQGHRRRGHGPGGLLHRGRGSRAGQRDQHHPRLHRDQRLPAALGGLGLPYPALIARLIELALERR